MNTENISFDDNKFKYQSRNVAGQSDVPAITRMLMRHGIVKTEQQGTMFMIGIIVLTLAATGFVMRTTLFPAAPEEAPVTITPEVTN